MGDVSEEDEDYNDEVCIGTIDVKRGEVFIRNEYGVERFEHFFWRRCVDLILAEATERGDICVDRLRSLSGNPSSIQSILIKGRAKKILSGYSLVYDVVSNTFMYPDGTPNGNVSFEMWVRKRLRTRTPSVSSPIPFHL